MSINIFRSTLLVMLVFTLNKVMFSQVVNIEKIRKADHDGFAGNINLGFYLIDNGKKISQLTNDINLQYKKGKNSYIVLNQLDLMTIDNDAIVNSGFQHIRYNYTIKDSSFLTLEAFAQHQYNAMKLLKKRFLVGAGPRLRLINTKKISCHLGLIGMYDYEQLSDSLNTVTEFARLGSYLSFNWDITDNLFFSNITYYQPAFLYLDNYRVSSETNFQLKITKSLYFKVGIQTNYDSNPPESIQKLFYFWENALGYSF